jgi:hypothetical protein
VFWAALRFTIKPGPLGPVLGVVSVHYPAQKKGNAKINTNVKALFLNIKTSKNPECITMHAGPAAGTVTDPAGGTYKTWQLLVTRNRMLFAGGNDIKPGMPGVGEDKLANYLVHRVTFRLYMRCAGLHILPISRTSQAVLFLYPITN